MLEELLIITFCVVFVIDQTDLVDNIKTILSKFLTKGKISSNNFQMKPFDCSLCMTFWLCLIWVLCNYKVTLYNVGLCFFMAFLAQFVNDIINMFKIIWVKIMDAIC